MPGLFSIVAGVIGFSIPVLGVVASCAGIYLGVRAFRAGRAAVERSSVVCGVIGVSLCGLGITFWVMVVLFELYD